MTSFKTKGRDIPTTVSRWIEKHLGRKVLKSEEVTIWAMQPVSKKEHEKIRKKWDIDGKSRKRRLARVANKMLKTGMSQADADIVRRGGWKD